MANVTGDDVTFLKWLVGIGWTVIAGFGAFIAYGFDRKIDMVDKRVDSAFRLLGGYVPRTEYETTLDTLKSLEEKVDATHDAVLILVDRDKRKRKGD